MPSDIKAILSPTLKPIEEASGLASDLYISDEFNSIEEQKVFYDNWAALTQACRVPEPGHAMPINFLSMPLLVVRNAEGEIKVFQNVCRHRGMKLIDQPCKLRGLITCPYHAWGYSLDGELKATPHVGGPDIHEHPLINPEKMNLLEVRSHVWRDVIFVNVNANAPPFEDANKEIIKRWQDFEQPLYSGGEDSRFTLSLNSNWKLAIDNYCESYHLPFVHPGLNEYSRLEEHYNIVGKSGFAGQGTTVYNPRLGNGEKSFPNFANLPQQWDTGAEYIALFPNVLFGVHRDHAYSIIIEPIGNRYLNEHIEIYYATAEACGNEYAILRRENTKLWKIVFEEDIGVVEGMYEGRFARDYDGGKFSPVMEPPTWRFHHWVAEQMLR